VEVDGDVHDLQKEEDEPPPTFGHLPQIPRTWNLGEAGWGRNDEVVRGLSAVVGKIKSVLVYSATR